MWSGTWKLYLGTVDGLGSLGGTASGPQASIDRSKWAGGGGRASGRRGGVIELTRQQILALCV